MSEFLYYSSEFDELAKIEKQIIELESMLLSGEVAEGVHDILNSAIVKLKEQASELASQDVIVDIVSEIGAKATTELESLDAIERIVDDRELLGPDFVSRRDELTETRANISIFLDRYPELKRNDKLIGYTGLTALTGAFKAQIKEELIVDIEPESTETEQEPEEPVINIDREVNPEFYNVSTVKITFGHNVVRVGKSGQVIPYSSRSTPEQEKYSDMRRKTLMYIISRQGEEISPYDIWKEINPDEEFDGSKMVPIRAWLQKLTFRKSQLIKNKNRGVASRYWVDPRFNLELDIDTDQSTDLETPESFVEGEILKIMETKKQNDLDFGDCYVMARHLHQFNDILTAYGCSGISDEMILSLESYQPDLSHLRGKETEIHKYRQDALARVQRFISDESKLFSFLDKTQEGSGQLAFIEFLSDLDEDQRALVNRLLTSRRTLSVQATTKGGLCQVPPEVIDANGNPITVIETPIAGAVEFKSIDRAQEVDITDVEEQEPETDLEAEEQTDPIAIKESIREIILEQLKERIIELSVQWQEAGYDLDKTYKTTQVSKTFNTHVFSRSNIRAFNKKFLHGNGRLDFEEAIEILMRGDAKLKQHYKNYQKEIRVMILRAKEDLSKKDS